MRAHFVDKPAPGNDGFSAGARLPCAFGTAGETPRRLRPAALRFLLRLRRLASRRTPVLYCTCPSD